MSKSRSTAQNPLTDVRQSGVAFTSQSLMRSILTGGIGFSIASLCVFATVIAQRWMYRHLGVIVTYIVWIALFILLGGRALSSLVVDTRRRGRFYVVFGLAFFAYGISWMAAYFTFRNAVGEWLGSLVGAVCMALVFAAWFGVLRSAPLFGDLSNNPTIPHMIRSSQESGPPGQPYDGQKNSRYRWTSQSETWRW